MLRLRFEHLAIFILIASLLAQATPVYAGTTGGLSGTVIEDGTKKPISITTNDQGHFAFVSLAPDTYIVFVQKQSYEIPALVVSKIVSTILLFRHSPAEFRSG